MTERENIIYFDTCQGLLLVLTALIHARTLNLTCPIQANLNAHKERARGNRRRETWQQEVGYFKGGLAVATPLSGICTA